MCAFKTIDCSGQSSGENIKGMNVNGQSKEEAKLITAILDGDIQRFHQLILPYQRSIYRMSLFYMKNEEEAEDVAQETFIKAYRNLSAFRGDSRFSTWLISIALNEARNRLRQKATARIVSLDEPVREGWILSPALLSDWRELPSDVIERKEIRQVLEKAVAMLPNPYQQVFLLREVEELSGNETAKIMGITVSLVKVRLHRARIMLQRTLAPKLRAIQTHPRFQRMQPQQLS
jgi:RNA polymerase sigma-70 factor, ECF subfamily